MRHLTFRRASSIAVAIVSALCPTIARTEPEPFSSPVPFELALTASPSFAPFDPGAAESRAVAHLKLARQYAQLHHVTEAMTEYGKAIEGGGSQTRAYALAESEKTLTESDRIQAWVREKAKSAVDTLVTTTVTAFGMTLGLMISVLPIAWWGARRRRGRRQGGIYLRVEPLQRWPGDSPYSHFAEIMSRAAEEMREYEQLNRRIATGTTKTVASTFINQAVLKDWQAPVSTLSEKIWPVFAWLIERFDRPDYTLAGSISFEGFAYDVLLRLSTDSESMQTWRRTLPAANLADGLANLGYSILVWIADREVR
ncbi:MAG: hypothetical protein QOI07_3228 [Verrucomicrobiota bacterium]|jgi:hypothetical protein